MRARRLTSDVRHRHSPCCLVSAHFGLRGRLLHPARQRLRRSSHRAVGLSPPHVASAGVLQRRRLVGSCCFCPSLGCCPRRPCSPRMLRVGMDRAGRRCSVRHRRLSERRLRPRHRGPTHPRANGMPRHACWDPSGGATAVGPLRRFRSEATMPFGPFQAGLAWVGSLNCVWCRVAFTVFYHVPPSRRAPRLGLTTVVSFAILGVCRGHPARNRSRVELYIAPRRRG